MTIYSPTDVLFDSEDAGSVNQITGDRDNPTFVLSPPIQDCVGFCLMYANVPFTYFVIDSTNNQFVLNYNSLGNSTVSIVPGTYTSGNIGTQITAAILTATGPSSGATPAGDLKILVDNTTSRMVIYSNANTPFTIDFSLSTTVARFLGFQPVLRTSVSSTFFDNAEVSITKHNVQGTRVINLSGPAQMFLSSSFGSSVHGKIRNQTSTQSLIGFWPVNANYQGTIEYVRENPPMVTMSKTSISRINLKLLLGNRTVFQNAALTGTNNYLSLNGEAYQVGLRFFVEEDDQNQKMDSSGNSVMTTMNMKRSAVYNPMTAQQASRRFKNN